MPIEERSSRVAAGSESEAGGDKPDSGVGAGREITISNGVLLVGVLIPIVLAAGLVAGLRPMVAPNRASAQGGAVDRAPDDVVLTAAEVGSRGPVGLDDAPVLSAGATDVGASAHPLVGQAPPDLGGTLLDGQPAKLSDFIGQPLMINFWATWCPPCRIEMPWLQDTYEAHRDEGFVILAVNAGERVPASLTAEVVGDFVDRMGLTFPIFMPDDPYGAQRQYRAFGLPSTYLVNREGIIVEYHAGMYPNGDVLEAQVARLLGDDQE